MKTHQWVGWVMRQIDRDEIQFLQHDHDQPKILGRVQEKMKRDNQVQLQLRVYLGSRAYFPDETEFLTIHLVGLKCPVAGPPSVGRVLAPQQQLVQSAFQD